MIIAACQIPEGARQRKTPDRDWLMQADYLKAVHKGTGATAGRTGSARKRP